MTGAEELLLLAGPFAVPLLLALALDVSVNSLPSSLSLVNGKAREAGEAGGGGVWL